MLMPQTDGHSLPSTPLTPPLAARGEPRIGLLCWLSIAAAGVVGLGVRWWHLGRESLWFDEGYSAWVATLSPAQIIRVIQGDISPPLYYLLLHYWVRLLGDSEAALRAFSAAAASVSMLLLFLLARAVLKRPAAIAAAMWLMALSPLQVQYAQEARFYELASLLALGGLYAMQRFAEARRPGAFVALVLCSAAMVYIHNMMFFYLAALSVAWLMWPSPMSLRRRVLWIALANALVVMAYLPWVPSLLGQIRWISDGNFWASPPGSRELTQTTQIVAGVKNVKAGDWLAYAHLITSNRLVEWLNWLAHPLSAVLITGLLLGAVVLLTCQRDLRRKLLALLVYTMLPLGAIWLYSQRGLPVFIERVFVASSAIFPLLLAGLLAHDSRRLRRIAWPMASLMIVLAALSTAGYFAFEQKEQWRQASAYIDSLPREPRLVVFVANEGEMLYRYYHRRHGEPRPEQTLTGTPQSFLDLDPPKTIQRVHTAEDLTRLKALIDSGRFEQIVLVLSHTHWSDPENLTERYLNLAAPLVEDREFHYIRVLAYAVPPRALR